MKTCKIINQKMKQITLLSAVFSFLTITVFGQMPGRPGGMSGMAGGFGPSQTGRFYGKIIDSKTNKPVDAASVALISTKFDPIKRARKDTVISGMLTPSNGNFALEGVPFMGDYALKISALGYKPFEQKISFLTPEMQQKMMQAFAAMGQQQAGAKKDSGQAKPVGQAAPAGGNMMETMRKIFGNDMSQLAALADKDLGNLKLEQDATMLDNVTVTANRNMTLAVDRRIFNVDKNLAASGTTASELMRQIPSVNVDIDGNVTVRNATPTLLLDGRPTTLTLDQIPSDAIQSVELITNPSAKFDASGGTASILNIVMKKNRKAGYNGSVRAGIDSRPRPNFGGDFNFRQGKINAFANANVGMRKSLSWSDIVTNYYPTTTRPAVTVTQDIDNVSQGFFGFGRAGFDFLANNRNTFTLAGTFVRGQFDNEEKNLLRYDTFYNPIKTETTQRQTDGGGFFQNIGGTLGYKHLFSKPGHELTADVNYNQSRSESEIDFNNQSFFQDNSPKGPVITQRTKGATTSTFLVAQTDYANPLTKDLKLESGIRAQIRDFSSLNQNFFYLPSQDQWVLDPIISNNYEFTDRVFAAYATITGKKDKLGYNFGLRAESSDYKGRLVDKDSAFSVQFPFSLFPSAFLSYKLTSKSDLQANYTRRINRPNFFQLLPFPDFTDPLNIRVGNAGLRPEFTNSIEVNYNNQFNSRHNLLVSGYFKNTNDIITNYVYRAPNPLTPLQTKDSVFYNTYVNANKSYTYGLELIGRNTLSNRFDLTTNLNFYNATINSENLQQDLNNSRFSFFGKVTATYKSGKNNEWVFQANADYQAKTVLPPGGRGGGVGGGRGPGGGMFGGVQPSGSQGYQNPNYGLDLSIRRDIIKNKTGQGYQGSLTLSMNDVFRTRIYDVVIEDATFNQNLRRRRDPQIVRLQFNWRFGKIDTNLFRRKNLKGEMEGMSEGMGGMQ
jgi:outer membrane receptor protein involved in Fe transport